jgi:ubiquinone/menaquinone biosynthesis C-methylase UbiE
LPAGVCSARVAWIERLAGCEDILIAGVGHGHFLAQCARRFPRARITSVDASAGMLRRAEGRARRAAPCSELEFVVASLPAWRPAAASCDAIVTNFFLDCFPPAELGEVVAALAGAARPKARWLVTDFAVPSRGAARQRARLVHALMYTFFRRVTKLQARRLTEPDALLGAQGFELVGRKTTEWGLLRSDVWLRA